MAIKTVFITTLGASTFTVPADFVSLVSVEAIGAGGTINIAVFGGSGGGGGAYAKSTSITGIVANGTAFVSVGAGATGGATPGGDTWFNAVSNAAPTLATQGVLAKGGLQCTNNTGGAGGPAASSVGDVKFSGGAGGSSAGFVSNSGGGGAAGPGGAGGNGGNSVVNGGGTGGGGGASLTSAGNAGQTNSGTVTGGAGGNGGGGAGGGAAATASTAAVAGTTGTGGGGGGGHGASPNWSGAAGGTGSIWTQTSNGAVAGPGGGGGGGGGGSGGSAIAGLGGLYGGGGGGGFGPYQGGQGIVVFTYDATPPPVVTTFVNQISGNGSKSICCFFQTNSVNRMGIAGTRQLATSTGWVFCVNRTTAGNLTYFHTGGSALEVAAGIVTGTWYYGCATYDVTTATATLYLNGSAIGSPATSFSAITTSTFNGVVAAEDNAFSSPFVGNIANLVIYNRALTQSEIAQNFQALRGRFGI
jgi:hypothetical protein